MRSLLLLLTAGCGDVSINVGAEKGDANTVPDSGDTAGADTSSPIDTADSGNGLDVWEGGGAWSADAPVTVYTEGADSAIEALWIRDVTGDDNEDIVVVSFGYTGATYLRTVVTYPGDGRGGFGAPLTTVGTVATSGSQAIALTDLDTDGQPDVLAPSERGLQVFFGNGSGFAADVEFDRGYYHGANVGAVDLDGDDADELIVWSTDSSGHQYTEMLRWDGRGLAAITPLISWDPYLSTYGTLFPGETVGYDADGDGRQEGLLSGIGYSLPQDMIVTGTGAGAGLTVSTSYLQTRYSADGATYADAADLDGDGEDELVTGGNDGLQLYDPSNGLQALIYRQDTTYTFGTFLVAGNLNGDEHPDVVEMLGAFSEDGGAVPSAVVSSHLGNGTDLDAPTQLSFPFSAVQNVMRGVALGSLSEDNCGDVAFIAGYPQAAYVMLGRCGG